MADLEKSPMEGGREGGGFASVLSVIGPFLGLILITILFAYLTRKQGTFLTLDNWRTIALQTVIVGTAALGMTMIMISGGIDLSVGSAVALITVLVSLAARDLKWPMPVAMAAGVAAGGLCGLLNGKLITGLRVVPFIITLGTLKVFRGLAKWLAESTAVYVPRESKSWWFNKIMAVEPEPAWLQVAPAVWILLALSAASAIFLRYSVPGRYLYAIGSSESTARLCGIVVPRMRLMVYGLAGLATGIAGVMQFLYMDGTGDPTTADGLELQVIAAVVIGGGSLAGGEGTILGTLIGCVFMSVLNNGCVHADISNAAQDIVIGIIIVAAVTLDRMRRSRLE